jgi:heptosyltransferase-2
MALHMASAFRIPTVAVFCATAPEFGFGPWENPESVVVQDATLPCKPCGRHGSNRCPNGTEACMTIDANEVINACAGFL